MPAHRLWMKSGASGRAEKLAHAVLSDSVGSAVFQNSLITQGDQLAFPVGAGFNFGGDRRHILQAPAVPVDDAVELVVEIGVAIELVDAFFKVNRLRNVVFLQI